MDAICPVVFYVYDPNDLVDTNIESYAITRARKLNARIILSQLAHTCRYVLPCALEL